MHNCNFCRKELTEVFCDLGFQPPSNSFLTAEQLDQPEVTYPLRAYVCSSCFLVQVPDYGFKPFTESYPYYSSDSPSNVSHAKEFAEEMVKRFKPRTVLEIGSNDGYMLQWFKEKECSVIGFDLSSGPAQVARKNGIATIVDYFGKDSARTYSFGQAPVDLICSINTLAHQPNINDFVEGLRIALKPGGVVVMEFPWLLKTIEGLQFDQIYQEHYSYFSLSVLQRIFAAHGLRIFDAEEIPFHGGSLRIYADHLKYDILELHTSVNDVIAQEWSQDLQEDGSWRDFQSKIEIIRRDFLNFLTNEGQAKSICAYGAPAKSSTFLNFCKVTPDLLPFTVDISPHKQGKFMPGSHIPILTEEDLKKYKPDYVVVLAWNLKNEIMQQLSYVRDWGCKFVVAIPRLEII